MTPDIIRHFLVPLALATVLFGKPAWGRGVVLQSLAWQGTTNAILSLNTAHSVGATASSGLPVTLRVDTGPAVLANGMLTVTALGTVVVTAEQAGDPTYAATRASRSFNVRRVALTSVGGFTPGGPAYGLHVVGDRAYVAAGTDGLQVLGVADPTHPVRLGGWTYTNLNLGFARGVQFVDPYAYVVNQGYYDGQKYLGAGLVVVDVGNPANPARVGGVDTQGFALGIQVVGNHAYVAEGSEGLEIFDVGNPAHPVRVGGHDTIGDARGVSVAGNLAYVAADRAGLQVMDVNNPEIPVRVGEYKTPGVASGVQVVGSYAYVADSFAGLVVVDVSNPANPVRVGGYDTGVAYGVQVVGNHAYVASSTGLVVLDVSDPANPMAVGAHMTGDTYGVQAMGNHAYLVDEIDGLQILESRLGYPQTLDWSGNPNPGEILALNVPHPLGATAGSGLPVTLHVDSGPAVIANGTITVTGPGTVVVTAEQVGDPEYLPVRLTRSFNVRQARLTFLGGFATPGGDAFGVEVVGRHAYVAEYGAGLLVLDVSDPANPVSEGGYDTSGEARGVQVVGDYAYVADGSDGLQVMDVRNPGNPVPAGNHVTGGLANAVQVVGNLAYVAAWNVGLQVIDVSQPTHPVRVGTFLSSGAVSDVHVVGNLAYLAADSAGLQVLDVSDPAHPVWVSGAVTRGHAFAVRVSGKHAYVVDRSNGLQVIDVGNPANPIRVGNIETGGNASHLEVVGNYAYVADSRTGLVVLDVGNPAKPVWVGVYDQSRVDLGVQVVGNRAYVADGLAGLKIVEVRLGYPQTLDFTPPADVPITAGFLELPRTTASGGLLTWSVLGGAARVEGERLTLIGPGEVRLRAEQAGDELHLPWQREWTILTHLLQQTLAWRGTTNDVLRLNTGYPLATTASSGLPVTLRVESGPASIVDGTIVVSGPGAVVVTAEQAGNAIYAATLETRSFNVRQALLTPVGRYETGGPVQRVQVVGNHAYLTDYWAGLQVIDVSNPAKPVRVAGYDTGGEARGVQVVGDYAFVADGSAGLQVIDVSNPASPTPVGGYDTSGFALGVQVVGNLAYVADNHAGLQIIDTGNPAKPVRIGGYDTSGYAISVQVVGNRAYIADNQAGLQVIAVDNPAGPVRLGGYATIGYATGVQVVGNRAYVAAAETGLLVIDVSNPASPMRVGGYDTKGIARDVRVVGNLAYVADSGAGLQVLDVSDPASPVRVGGYDTGGFAVGLQVSDNYAYVADLGAGLQVMDVSLPANPVLVGGFDTAGSARGVQVVGKYAYVADDSAGLQILELRFGYPQTLELRLPPQVPLQSLPVASVGTASSGLPLTLLVVSGPATVVDNQLVLSGPGPVTFRADQAGNDDYLPASAQWTVTVSATPPRLGARLAGGQVEVFWAAGVAGLILQGRESLEPDSFWQPVTTPPVEADGEARVRLEETVSLRYFRLVR